jgi:hypothetical protein
MISGGVNIAGDRSQCGHVGERTRRNLIPYLAAHLQDQGANVVIFHFNEFSLMTRIVGNEPCCADSRAYANAKRNVPA